MNMMPNFGCGHSSYFTFTDCTPLK